MAQFEDLRKAEEMVNNECVQKLNEVERGPAGRDRQQDRQGVLRIEGVKKL
jgi:hypothetical protein